MHNDPVRLIEELILDITAVQYHDHRKIKALHDKSIKIVREFLDSTDELLPKIEGVTFEPKSSYYLVMSDQMRQQSWAAGKNILVHLLNQIKDSLSSTPKVVSLQKPFKNREKTVQLLSNSLASITKAEENKFLEEAIKCYEVGAWRASIIMIWNLTLDHLYEYVLLKELNAFNNVLARNTERRIKITAIAKKDDFGEIPENKFIEFCRSSNIISNDVRKILDSKLGTRNTYAHPSNVSLNESKVIDFIEDLVENVILKFDFS